MRQNQDPLAAPCAAYVDLHPALTLVESVMAQLTEAQQKTGRLTESLHRVESEVDPTAWTSKIEEARNDNDELAKLRIQYDEKALTFISVYLHWAVVRSGMYEGRSSISDAICKLIIAHDEIDDRGAQAFLKPIMKARAVRAMAVHRTDPEGKSSKAPVNYDSMVEAANEILVVAFNRLIEYLPEVKRGRPYSTDCVVQGKPILGHLNADVDLRSVSNVPFKDCVNSKHPHSHKLAEMLEELRDRYDRVRNAEGALKSDQNGRINERQHAHRLIQFLHSDEAPDAPRCGGNLETQVANQDKRRYDYECVRQLLQAELRSFRQFIEELVTTLEASIEEGKALLAEVTTDDIVTIDRKETVKIIMVNCLAADQFLRRYVRFLMEAEHAYHGDLSRGAGSRCLEARFADVQSNYGWQAGRMKEEAEPTEKSETSD